MLPEERRLKELEPVVLPLVRAALADPPTRVAGSAVASAWWSGVVRGLRLTMLTGLDGVTGCAALADLFGDTDRSVALLEATTVLPPWGLAPTATRETVASIAYRSGVLGRWGGPVSVVEPWVSVGVNRGPGPIRPTDISAQRMTVPRWGYRIYGTKARLAVLAEERAALCVDWAQTAGGARARVRIDARIADVDARIMSIAGVWS